MEKIKVTLLTVLKTKTNNGKTAHQAIRLLSNGEIDKDSIHIDKKVLVAQDRIQGYIDNGYSIGRTFKDMTIIQQRFIIKVSSFKEISKLI
jgi:hypothetical protein